MSLPPVGSYVKLAGPSPELVPLHPEWAGKTVKIYAHFETNQGNKLAAYVSDDHLIGGCGIESMFAPIRTPEQIAAEVREKAIQQMIDDTNILTGIMSDRKTMTGQLYDAGYRKFEITDEQP